MGNIVAVANLYIVVYRLGAAGEQGCYQLVDWGKGKWQDGQTIDRLSF